MYKRSQQIKRTAVTSTNSTPQFENQQLQEINKQTNKQIIKQTNKRNNVHSLQQIKRTAVTFANSTPYFNLNLI